MSDMRIEKQQERQMKRRDVLAGLGVMAAAGAARADEPKVFLDYTQKQLDDAYTQVVYQPNQAQVLARFAANSEQMRQRIGPPKTIAYGSAPIEQILFYPAPKPNGTLFLFVHGGAWLAKKAEDYMFPAEVFLDRGVGFAAVDFSGVDQTNGALGPVVDQICRAIRFTAQNTANFGVDPSKLLLGAHSSGAHFAGVALTTDWRAQYGIAPNIFRSAVLISGLYDLRGPRLSVRSSYVKFTDADEAAFSAQRHIDRLVTPLIVMHGTRETPEFQRQTRDFAAAVKAAGKPVDLRVGVEYSHFDMQESLGNPYAIAGRAAVELCRA
jgi:arylformamidase